MNNEERQKAALSMLALAEKAQAETIKLREAKTKQFKSRAIPCLHGAVGALFGGWFAFVLAKIFSWPAFSVGIGFGLTGGALMYYIEARSIKKKELESALIKKIVSYPGFKKRYDRKMLWHFLGYAFVFVAFIGGTLLGDRHYPAYFRSSAFESLFPYLFGVIFCLFFYVAFKSQWWLYGASCPTCETKLSVRKHRTETPDSYSGLCKQCGTLWDLDVGNSSD